METKVGNILNELGNKTDCELFDEEINNIKSAINALSMANSNNDGNK